jgi:hypothetical protein
MLELMAVDSGRVRNLAIEVLKYVATTAGGIIITAVIKGEPLAGLIRLRTLSHFLTTSTPLWIFLIALVVCVGLTTALVRAKVTPGPKLHVSWDRGQCLWHKGSVAGKPAMQIMGSALISSADTTETLIIREAYIKGTEPLMNLLGDLVIEPGQVYSSRICTFVGPVIIGDVEPLNARLILVDHKNRKFVTARTTFRPTPVPNLAAPATGTNATVVA